MKDRSRKYRKPFVPSYNHGKGWASDWSLAAIDEVMVERSHSQSCTLARLRGLAEMSL